MRVFVSIVLSLEVVVSGYGGKQLTLGGAAM